MTGDAEFNEVFLTDVVVPDDHRLGDEGDGWRVALTALINERAAIGGAFAAHGRGPVDTLVEVYRRRHDGDPVARQRVADAWIRAEVLRLTNQRASRWPSGERLDPRARWPSSAWRSTTSTSRRSRSTCWEPTRC